MASYLLDTHAFIWLDSAPENLTARVRDTFENAQNTIYLSTASAWEMQIKLQLGKLAMKVPLDQMVESQVSANRLHILDIRLPHVLALSRLPAHHKDPFDRILIAQAVSEDLVLISHDAALSLYPVKTLW